MSSALCALAFAPVSCGATSQTFQPAVLLAEIDLKASTPWCAAGFSMTKRRQTRGEQYTCSTAPLLPPTAGTRAYLRFQRMQAAISLFATFFVRIHCQARTANHLREGISCVLPVRPDPYDYVQTTFGCVFSTVRMLLIQLGVDFGHGTENKDNLSISFENHCCARILTGSKGHHKSHFQYYCCMHIMSSRSDPL